MKNEIEIRKRTLVVSVMLALFVGIILIFFPKTTINTETLNADITTLEKKFAVLSKARTNFCAGPNILELTDSDRLQGSCCSAMDFHRYKEQVEGLKKYSDIDKIPEDPYDISKELTNELLDYQKNINLTSEQQKIYDGAVLLSDEKGPCCCKCWRWYAFEGLAKYLITEHDFNSEQIAEVWNLEDGCGGKGHAEGEGH
ncbi:hypothetical protein COU59_03455 [Candidatus Pacearchaeota archaeon CG10_big_fil_rev_8_21_14_0_10_34_12]|nr:MAG: hypothetical protein COU59_03455 [Candidatus Pacearchaeota archaeon CG10_big_fil_rev_8_21_14_0_10_34_12]